MRNSLAAYCLLGFFTVPVLAGNQSIQDSAGIYFEDVSHLLSVRIYPLAKIHSLELKVPNGTISLQPDGTGSLGLGFNYKWLGFGFSAGFPASSNACFPQSICGFKRI